MSLPTFKATGIVSFNRTEVKTRRNWWQKFLKWWTNEEDIPMYSYEVEMHTDSIDVRINDLIMCDDYMVFRVVFALTTIKIKPLAPTDKWLIYSDFKHASYVIIATSFGEGKHH